MGGAFTAVADDASAAFWNPAGFASGSFFSLVLDTNTSIAAPAGSSRWGRRRSAFRTTGPLSLRKRTAETRS